MIADLYLQSEFQTHPESGPKPLRLAGEMAHVINSAEERELPMVFAYVDEDGGLRQSFRGSIHVHGDQALAFWNRDPNGGFIRALKCGYSQVCATYREHDTPRVLQFHGRARLVEGEDEAQRVWNESPELERQLTHGRNGVAVVIELDQVRGVDLVNLGEWEPFTMARACTQTG